VDESKRSSAPSPSAPKHVGPRLAMDSAEHLFAAFPVLTAIAHWTGRIGTVFIKRLILRGKIKGARRNAAIIAAGVVVVFVLLMACIIWLAKLP
jgi:hypothetical protein